MLTFIYIKKFQTHPNACKMGLVSLNFWINGHIAVGPYYKHCRSPKISSSDASKCAAIWITGAIRI